MLGLAAGDRNGGPVQLAMRLGESLALNGCLDVSEVCGRYVKWCREGAFDTGPVTLRALALIDTGVDLREASAIVDREMKGMTAGCNPAHRIAPMAAAAFISDDELPELARAEARLTHANRLAGDAASAVAVLCRSLIRGASWEDAIVTAMTGRLPDTQQAIELSVSARGDAGGFAPLVLQSALYFLQEASGFSHALEASLRFAGAPNYCPVLVGAIGGARWGESDIPPSMLRHCVIEAELRRVADSLAAGWSPDAAH